MYKASIEDAGEKLAEATGDGDVTVVSWVMFGAFFVEGGYIGFLAMHR